MATSYDITVEQRGAYALDEQILYDIYEAAKAFLDEGIEIEIECSGGAYKIKAEELSEALDDPLLRAHPITKIELSGSDYGADPKRRFSFKAEDDMFTPTVKLDIRGNHKDCSALASQLEKLISAKRQAYSPIAPNGDVTSGITTILAILAILAAPVAATYLVFGPERVPIPIAAETVLAFPLLWILHRLRKTLFPSLVVEIRRSADIATRAKNARTTLLVGIVLALVVGVAASLIANRLSR
jgi:hypothetical protein